MYERLSNKEVASTMQEKPFWEQLLDKYRDWEIIHHNEGTFTDSHLGDIHHEHAFERIIAKRIV